MPSFVRLYSIFLIIKHHICWRQSLYRHGEGITIERGFVQDHNIDALAAYLVRRIPNTSEKLMFRVRALATDLLAVGKNVPPDCALLLGGSLARGEPCIHVHGTDTLVYSNADLMFLHGEVVPPKSFRDFWSRTKNEAPYVSLSYLRQTQFEALATVIGKEYRKHTVQLSEAPVGYLPSPTLTARDAFEIAIDSFAEYFERDIAGQYARGQASNFLAYTMNRVELNALRSVIILNGGFSYHDIEVLPSSLQELATSALDWRDAVSAPAHYDHFHLLQTFDAVLYHHQKFGYGQNHGNAVSGSQFDGQCGSQYVIAFQEFVLAFLQMLLSQIGEKLADAQTIHQIEKQSWQDLLSQFPWVVRASSLPHVTLNTLGSYYREQLLQMKL